MKCSMARLETLLSLGTLPLFGCQQQWVSPYSASHTIAASMMPIDGMRHEWREIEAIPPRESEKREDQDNGTSMTDQCDSNIAKLRGGRSGRHQGRQRDYSLELGRLPLV